MIKPLAPPVVKVEAPVVVILPMLTKLPVASRRCVPPVAPVFKPVVPFKVVPVIVLEAAKVVIPDRAPVVVTLRALDVRLKVPVALPMAVLAVPVALIETAPVVVWPPLTVSNPVTVKVPPTLALLVTVRAVPAALKVLAWLR